MPAGVMIIRPGAHRAMIAGLIAMRRAEQHDYTSPEHRGAGYSVGRIKSIAWWTDGARIVLAFAGDAR